MMQRSSDPSAAVADLKHEGGSSYTRLFSRKKPSPSPSASFRMICYYSPIAPAAVPFLWESQPGTPKHPSSGAGDDPGAAALPPLTPPPSHQLRYRLPAAKPAFGLLGRLRRRRLPSSPSLSSSSLLSKSLSISGSAPEAVGGGGEPRRHTLCF